MILNTIFPGISFSNGLNNAATLPSSTLLLTDSLTLLGHLRAAQAQTLKGYANSPGVEISAQGIAGVTLRKIAGITARHASEYLTTGYGHSNRRVTPPQSFLNLPNKPIFISNNAINNPNLLSVLDNLPDTIPTLIKAFNDNNFEPIYQEGLVINVEKFSGGIARFVIQSTDEVVFARSIPHTPHANTSETIAA